MALKYRKFKFEKVCVVCAVKNMKKVAFEKSSKYYILNFFLTHSRGLQRHEKTNKQKTLKAQFCFGTIFSNFLALLKDG